MPEQVLKILLDQNIPVAVAKWLRDSKPGWIIRHVNEVDLAGKPDERIFEWAQADGSIVITYDEDFADVRMFSLGRHHGVIRLRVWPTTIEKTIEALDRLFKQVPSHEFTDSLVVIDDNKIRIRKSRQQSH
ncbi:MAG: DUF5615 family PIN-like protein [Nitrospirota bacterium]